MLTKYLVDQHDQQFSSSDLLAQNGYPIFVFEDPDTAQVMKEETREVREAVEGTGVGIEA